MKHQESMLESGLLVLGIIIAVAMAILAGSRTMTSREGRLRRNKQSPAPGTIDAERHQHISTVAAR